VQLPVRIGILAAQALDALAADVAARLAQQLMGEEAAAHAYLAVNSPYRQFDALAIKRFLRREHVLINAVDEGSSRSNRHGVVMRMASSSRRDCMVQARSGITRDGTVLGSRSCAGARKTFVALVNCRHRSDSSGLCRAGRCLPCVFRPFSQRFAQCIA
jgi:hypothetical protein